jgi:hypothetical protein
MLIRAFYFLVDYSMKANQVVFIRTLRLTGSE